MAVFSWRTTMIRHQIWGTKFSGNTTSWDQKERHDTGGRLEPELFCIVFPDIARLLAFVKISCSNGWFSWFFMIFHGFHWLPFSISPFFSRTGQKLSSRGVACGLMAGALALCRRRRCQRAPVDVADVSISTAAAMRSWGVFMASTSLLYGIIDLDGFSDNIRHFCSWLDMPLIDFVSYTHEIRWIYRWLWHQVVPSWDGTVTASQISKNQGYHETEHEAMNRPKQLKLGLALFGRWFFLQTSGNKSRWGNLEGDEENGKTKLIETKQTRHHGDLGQLDFRFKCLQKLGKSTRFDLSKTCPPYFQLWNIKQMKAGFRST